MSSTTFNPGTSGYYGTPAAPAPAAVPQPVTVNVNAYQGTPSVPAMPTDTTALSTTGAILPIQASKWLNGAAKVVPTGTQAAIGAASAIAANSGRAMQSAVAGLAGKGEPLFKLTWGIAFNLAGFVGNLVTFQWASAFQKLGSLVKDGFVNTGEIAKRVGTPASLTMATAGGTKASLGQAIGAGLKTGATALKSSFIWAIPAAAINAFIDYKYKDQTDVKRIGTNFGADVIGYTAGGMAGAAVGAAVGSMTMPIVGTIVGAGVGILLGYVHDKTTRPLISDFLHDALA
jgi:hypothetical protein